MSTEKTPPTMPEILKNEIYKNINQDILLDGVKNKITKISENNKNREQLNDLKDELINLMKKYQDIIPAITIDKTFSQMLADKANKYIKKDQIEGLLCNSKIPELKKNRKSQLETLEKKSIINQFIRNQQENNE